MLNKITGFIKIALQAMIFRKDSQKEIMKFSFVFHLVYCYTLLFFLPLFCKIIIMIIFSQELFLQTTILMILKEMIGITILMVIIIILFVLLKKTFAIFISNQYIIKTVLFINSIRAFLKIGTYISNSLLIKLVYFIYSIWLIHSFFSIESTASKRITVYVLVVYGSLLFLFDLAIYPLAYLLLNG